MNRDYSMLLLLGLTIYSNRTSHPYVSCVGSLTSEISSRFISLLNNYDFFYFRTESGKRFKKSCDFAHKVSQDVIASRKNALANSAPEERTQYLDFLDILLLARDEQDKGLTDCEIQQEVDTFLLAGHDTTASAISWCLYALAGHPEHQNKIREELKEAVVGRDSNTLDWNSACGLPYLARCVKESLRLYPPVPFPGREISTPVKIEGAILQPGTIVQLNIWAVHHNEHVWGPDHMDFKPERFLAENEQHMDTYAYIPFTAGPRNCIGQHFALHEIKIVVGRIILAFNLRRDPDHKAELFSRISLQSRDGVKLILSPSI